MMSVCNYCFWKLEGKNDNMEQLRLAVASLKHRGVFKTCTKVLVKWRSETFHYFTDEHSSVSIINCFNCFHDQFACEEFSSKPRCLLVRRWTPVGTESRLHLFSHLTMNTSEETVLLSHWNLALLISFWDGVRGSWGYLVAAAHLNSPDIKVGSRERMVMMVLLASRFEVSVYFEHGPVASSNSAFQRWQDSRTRNNLVHNQR